MCLMLPKLHGQRIPSIYAFLLHDSPPPPPHFPLSPVAAPVLQFEIVERPGAVRGEPGETLVFTCVADGGTLVWNIDSFASTVRYGF